MKQKTLSVRRLYKLRDMWIESQADKKNLYVKNAHEKINSVTSYLEFVSQNRNKKLL